MPSNLVRLTTARVTLLVLASLIYGGLVALGQGLALEWDRPNLATKGTAVAGVAGLVFAFAASRRLALSSREVTS